MKSFFSFLAFATTYAAAFAPSGGRMMVTSSFHRSQQLTFVESNILSQRKLVADNKKCTSSSSSSSSSSLKASTIADQDKYGFSTRKTLPPLLTEVKKALTLTPKEISTTLFQLSLFLNMVLLIRIPSIASWLANALRLFPHSPMMDFEPLSPLNWVVHLAAVGFNVGILQTLFKKNEEGSGVDSKKKRSYGVAAAGTSQVFGLIFMATHTLIGRSSPACQPLFNLGFFLVTMSPTCLGGMMLLPTKLGVLFSGLVGTAIMKGLVTFQNVPGIILSSVGLLSVLTASPKKDGLPRTFTIGYALLAMTALVSELMNMMFGVGNNLGHMLDAGYILVLTILQRWSLQRAEK